MKFQENARPIFQQIADRICDEVTAGTYPPDCRIPSVREYAACMQVNVNTVMRAIEYLSQQQVIYNKRGIGYFVAPDALERIRQMRAQTFFKEDMPYFFQRLIGIGMTPDELYKLYSEYFNAKK